MQPRVGSARRTHRLVGPGGRSELANSILVEFTNNFDLWYADPIPAGDGGEMHEPGGVITNIDSVVQMTKVRFLPDSHPFFCWNMGEKLPDLTVHLP